MMNKSVLVTGGTGLIGIPLVKRLVSRGAKVKAVSLDSESPFGGDVEFIRGDLTDAQFSSRVMKGMDIVFHLAGIKGGIGTAYSKAATFLVENLLLNTHVMEAARKVGVDWFVYVSSICIYPPAEVFREENAGTGLPHPSDKFGGMAKLVGEMQVEAYQQQYGLNNFAIVRPVNTYGPHDNFNPVSALVIPALVHRIFSGENPLKIWGDGTAVRDFVYADDVADLLLLIAERKVVGPYNIGSGKGFSVKEIAEAIIKYSHQYVGRNTSILWDASKPTGERYRVASIEKVRKELGWTPRVDLDTGIQQTIKWFAENHDTLVEKYNILSTE